MSRFLVRDARPGQILHLSVGATTALTALLAAGGGLGLLIAARWLNRGGDPFRVSAVGVGIGILAFSAVVFAAPLALRGARSVNPAA